MRLQFDIKALAILVMTRFAWNNGINIFCKELTNMIWVSILTEDFQAM